MRLPLTILAACTHAGQVLYDTVTGILRVR